MKKILLAGLIAALGLPAYSEEPTTNESLLTLRTEVRADWQGAWHDGDTDKSYTGFAGKFLNLRLDGNITDNLSYSWRQRFNKPHKDASFFDATDWAYINYNIGRWSIAGGKQIVAIGGWEYDRAPIDLYGCSVFWNHIPCYEFGASAGFRITGNDRLTFQLCESPFFTEDNRNMYAYNLMWNGSHGCFDAIWSANLIEYAPGKYINYLALGNKFTFGKFVVELDVMNRAASGQTFFFKDMSVMGELQFRPTGRWNIFLKSTYDVNHSGTAADATVADGTELKMAGGGVEFFPYSDSKNTLSLHATAFYSWGNAAHDAFMRDRTMISAIGVKWCMNLLSLKRK